MTNGLKRRGAKRHNMFLDPLLLDKEGRFIAFIKDASLTGMLLIAKRTPYQKGAIVDGWIQCPQLANYDETFAAVKLIVRWSKPEKATGWSSSGVEFAYELEDESEHKRVMKIVSYLTIAPDGDDEDLGDNLKK